MERSSIAGMLGTKLRVRLEPPYARLTTGLLLELTRNVEDLVVVFTDTARIIVESLLMLCSRNSLKPPLLADEPPPGKPIATLWRALPPSAEHNAVFAAGVRVRGLKLMRALKVGDSEYLIQVGEIRELVKVTEQGLMKATLPEELVKALEKVCELTEQYGPLHVSDAISTLSSEIGVRRGEARRLLVELALRKLVKIEYGYVLCKARELLH